MYILCHAAAVFSLFKAPPSLPAIFILVVLASEVQTHIFFSLSDLISLYILSILSFFDRSSLFQALSHFLTFPPLSLFVWFRVYLRGVHTFKHRCTSQGNNAEALRPLIHARLHARPLFFSALCLVCVRVCLCVFACFFAVTCFALFCLGWNPQRFFSWGSS